MKARLSPEAMGMRVAKEFFGGAYVNLGVGLPSYAYQSVGSMLAGRTVVLHTENGILGYGRPLTDDEEGQWDVNLVNATGNYVTELPGICYFDSTQAFGMARGRHLDVSVLGAYQVSERGDLANWATPDWVSPTGEIMVGSVGGAMDLAIGAKRVIVMMEHTTKKGELRILKECTYPVTALRCVGLIVTDIAVIRVRQEGLVLEEIAPDWAVEEVQSLTEPKLMVAPHLEVITL